MTTPSSESSLAAKSCVIGLSQEATTFNFEDADMTLRSCDGVDFHVHRWPLSKASPVFATLFHIPQPTSVAGDRQMCGMSEDSPSIKLLVAYCYPRSLYKEPLLDSIGDVERALALAKKFDMSFIADAAERAMEKLAIAMPDLVYALAWKFELSGIVRSAAFASLELPFLPNATTKSFAGLPAEALVQLWGYRSTQVADAVKPLKDASSTISWIADKDLELRPPPNNSTACTCGHITLPFLDKPQGIQMKIWWWIFVSELIAQLITFPVKP